jgi:hypothetical protein
MKLPTLTPKGHEENRVNHSFLTHSDSRTVRGFQT